MAESPLSSTTASTPSNSLSTATLEIQGQPDAVQGLQWSLEDHILEATVISLMDSETGLSRDLNQTHLKSIEKTDKHLLKSFKLLQSMCGSIGLSHIVIDSAKQFFKKVDDEKLLRGRRTNCIIAACIYIACREHRVTRTFKEICAITNVSKKIVVQCYKLLQPIFETPVQTISLDAYVTRFSSALDLKPEVIKETMSVRISLPGMHKRPLTTSKVFSVRCRSGHVGREIADYTRRGLSLFRVLSLSESSPAPRDCLHYRLLQGGPQECLPRFMGGSP